MASAFASLIPMMEFYVYVRALTRPRYVGEVKETLLKHQMSRLTAKSLQREHRMLEKWKVQRMEWMFS